jgi:predicted nucleic acid-binding protein
VRTAVDSSVLFDVLDARSRYHDASVAALKTAYDSGSIVVCEIVWAEVSAHFADSAACSETMAAIGASLDSCSKASAELAGRLWRNYPSPAAQVLDSFRTSSSALTLTSMRTSCSRAIEVSIDPTSPHSKSWIHRRLRVVRCPW